MNKKVSMGELVPLICEQIESNGKITFTPSGISMMPMLRNNKDTVTLQKAELPLKKYQIVLYKRSADKYVLHRVVGVCADGYLMRGDNQFSAERGIQDEQIIAVMSDFTRKGKEYGCQNLKYKLYSTVWVNTVMARKALLILKRAVKKALIILRRKLKSFN